MSPTLLSPFPTSVTIFQVHLTHLGKSRKLFLKNGRWHRGYPGNFFPDFFEISQFRVMREGILRKLFPGQFHEYLPIQKYLFPKRVMTQRLFRKLFPISGNSFRKFFCAITRIYEISIKNFDFGKRFRKISWFRSPESFPESLPI